MTPEELWAGVIAGDLVAVPEEAFASGEAERLTDEQLRQGLLAPSPVAEVSLGVAIRLRRFDLFDEVVQACRTIRLPPDGSVRAGDEHPCPANYFEYYAQSSPQAAKKVLGLLRYGPGLRDAGAFAIGYLRGAAPKDSLDRLARALKKETDPQVVRTLQKAIERVQAG